jgi:hypothetical protein
MTTLKRIVPLALCLAMTGCDSKQVSEYAKQLNALLDRYKAGVQARMTAEQQLYRDLSEIFATEAERDVYETLKTERFRARTRIASDLTEGRSTASQVVVGLRETAQLEHDRTRTFFQQELNAQKQYEAALLDLTFDKKKVAALGDALAAVQKEPGLETALQDVVGYAQAFQGEYDLQGCKTVESRLATLKESIADVKDEDPNSLRLPTLNTQATDLQKQLEADSHYDTKTKKCK